MKKYVYVTRTKANEEILNKFPSAGPNASISGMRKNFWGKDALIAKCGSYIYKVDNNTFTRFAF